MKPQTNRTTGPPGANDDGSRFPGKSKPFQIRLVARWSVKEDDTITSKVAKGKGKTRGKNGKTRGKNGKTAKGAEEQDNESTYSFQNYDLRRLLMFLYQGWYLHK